MERTTFYKIYAYNRRILVFFFGTESKILFRNIKYFSELYTILFFNNLRNKTCVHMNWSGMSYSLKKDWTQAHETKPNWLILKWAESLSEPREAVFRGCLSYAQADERRFLLPLRHIVQGLPWAFFGSWSFRTLYHYIICIKDHLQPLCCDLSFLKLYC